MMMCYYWWSNLTKSDGVNMSTTFSSCCIKTQSHSDEAESSLTLRLSLITFIIKTKHFTFQRHKVTTINLSLSLPVSLPVSPPACLSLCCESQHVASNWKHPLVRSHITAWRLMEGRCRDVSMFGNVSHVSRRDDLFSGEEEEEEARDEMMCVWKAAM